MFKTFFPILVFAAIAWAAEPGGKPPTKVELIPAKERKAAPGFALRDAAGKPVALTGLRGQVVLLNFWATWCGGCKLEIPWFQEFQNAFGRKRFAVVGVSVDDDGWGAVKPYLDKTKVDYRMVLATKGMPETYGVTEMPVTILIDRRGRTAARYTGVVDRADVEAKLRVLLAESK